MLRPAQADQPPAPQRKKVRTEKRGKLRAVARISFEERRTCATRLDYRQPRKVSTADAGAVRQNWVWQASIHSDTIRRHEYLCSVVRFRCVDIESGRPKSEGQNLGSPSQCDLRKFRRLRTRRRRYFPKCVFMSERDIGFITRERDRPFMFCWLAASRHRRRKTLPKRKQWLANLRGRNRGLNNEEENNLQSI